MKLISTNIDQTVEDQAVEIIMINRDQEKDMIQEGTDQEVTADMDPEIVNIIEVTVDTAEALVEKDGEKIKTIDQDLDPDSEIM